MNVKVESYGDNVLVCLTVLWLINQHKRIMIWGKCKWASASKKELRNICFANLGEERRTATPGGRSSRETATGQRVNFGESKNFASLTCLKYWRTARMRWLRRNMFDILIARLSVGPIWTCVCWANAPNAVCVRVPGVVSTTGVMQTNFSLIQLKCTFLGLLDSPTSWGLLHCRPSPRVSRKTNSVVYFFFCFRPCQGGRMRCNWGACWRPR